MKLSYFPQLALGSVFLAMGTLGISVSAKTPTLTPSQVYIAQADTSLTTIEQETYNQINQHRAGRKLPQLTLDPTISEQARIHSQNMANGSVPFSHNGFSQRVEAIAVVIPYAAAAENVAYNQGYSNPATQAVQGWLNSSGHRQNIEGNYNLTGIGVAKNARGAYYFTQIFIRRR